MNGRRLHARPRPSLSLTMTSLARLRRAIAACLATTGLAVVPTFVGSASAAPVTLAAAADATVAEDTPTANAGGAADLGVDGDPRTEAFIRFPAAGIIGPDAGSSAGGSSVTRATLRLFVLDPTKDAPTVHSAPTTWGEQTLTWANRPTRGTAVADVGAAARGTWVEYDVTGAVGANTPSGFVLVPDTGDGIDLASREADGNRPQLVVETAPASRGATLHVASRADAQVKEDQPDSNFGGKDGLGTRQSPDQRIETYLRFDVPSLPGPLVQATLRLFVTGSSADGPAVRAAGGGSWDENSLTWANRPGGTGTEADDLGRAERGWADLDVTRLVTGSGAVNLVLAGGSDDALWFRSREGTASERPELVIETAATAPATTVPPTTVPPTTTPTTTTTRPPATTTTTTRPDTRCDDRWEDSRNIAELPHGRAEMSGLAASTRHRGWGWGIRDSGNPAALYSFRLGSGSSVDIDEFIVPGASNSDWEDVVYTRGATGAGMLWVLENVGNGHGGNRRIYQVAEPDPGDPGAAVLLGRYDWAYPDGQYNTETMFVFDGDLVVVSKTSPSRVYRFEDGLRPATVNRPTYVGTLPTGSNLSVGSVSPDDRFLAVASHNSLYVYENGGDLSDLGDMIARPPVFSDKLPDANREAGGFFPAGSCDIVLVAENKTVWRSAQ